MLLSYHWQPILKLFESLMKHRQKDFEKRDSDRSYQLSCVQLNTNGRRTLVGVNRFLNASFAVIEGISLRTQFMATPYSSTSALCTGANVRA